MQPHGIFKVLDEIPGLRECNDDEMVVSSMFNVHPCSTKGNYPI